MSGFWEIKKVSELGLAHLPLNSIMAIYVKTAAEATELKEKGWFLCDGTDGTPNLIDYFIRPGIPGTNVTGDRIPNSGRTSGHQLNVAQMPTHRHQVPVRGLNITRTGGSDSSSDNKTDGSWSNYTGGNESHEHTLNIVPDYVYVGYFMFLGVTE